MLLCHPRREEDTTGPHPKQNSAMIRLAAFLFIMRESAESRFSPMGSSTVRKAENVMQAECSGILQGGDMDMRPIYCLLPKEDLPCDVLVDVHVELDALQAIRKVVHVVQRVLQPGKVLVSLAPDEKSSALASPVLSRILFPFSQLTNQLRFLVGLNGKLGLRRHSAVTARTTPPSLPSVRFSSNNQITLHMLCLRFPSQCPH